MRLVMLKVLVIVLIADEKEMTGLINLALIGLKMLNRIKDLRTYHMNRYRRDYEEGSSNGDVEAFINECYCNRPSEKVL